MMTFVVMMLVIMILVIDIQIIYDTDAVIMYHMYDGGMNF